MTFTFYCNFMFYIVVYKLKKSNTTTLYHIVSNSIAKEDFKAGATGAHEVRTLQRTYFMTDVAEVTTRHA
jgi:hypothetical protein